MDRTEFIKIMKKNHVPNFYYNIDGKGRDDDTESEALKYMCKELSE